MTENEPAPDPQGAGDAPRPTGFELRGTAISPGLAIGAVHRKDYDLERAGTRRVPLDQVERELNRFHASLQASRQELERLKEQLRGRVPEEHVRILDTHLTYLGDSVFLSDVENLILGEQLALEAAIAKVVADFDRIFRLVANEALRERAVDLRDVGIRVLRNLVPEEQREEAESRARDSVLVARELSIVDMFHLDGKEVLGIVTEEGGLTSHAAMLARSMGVPMVAGIEGLRERVQEGDTVILDAAEGVLRVNPDELVLEQYREARAAAAEGATRVEAEDLCTADGTPVRVLASCGNLPEVGQALAAGLSGVGLYRTELLYVIDREQPSLDSLVAHYAAVLEEAGGASVTFRLLDADSSFGLRYLHEGREPNPALGRAGVRALLASDSVLRRQLQALLRAAPVDRELRLAVPFVSDVGELRRVKEVLFDVRSELQSSGLQLTASVEVGVVIETPASVLGAPALLREVDFAALSYDGLVEHLLAADRENHDLAETFRAAHPVVLRQVVELARAATDAGVPLSVFGPAALQPGVLPLLLAAGLREVSASHVVLDELVRVLAATDLAQAEELLPRVLAAACTAETLPLVDTFLRAYDELEVGQA
jgi:phosphotransferase system enzyme I (PtsI)